MANENQQYFFTSDEEFQLVNYIQEAEKKTSGEIRIHIDFTCEKPQLERAKEVFYELQMQNTKQRNGVLFHLSVEQHGFAIFGDEGIDEVVPNDFWESVKNAVIEEFKDENFVKGLKCGIELAGEQLAQYFPPKDENQNELPDEISKA